MICVKIPTTHHTQYLTNLAPQQPISLFILGTDTHLFIPSFLFLRYHTIMIKAINTKIHIIFQPIFDSDSDPDFDPDSDPDPDPDPDFDPDSDPDSDPDPDPDVDPDFDPDFDPDSNSDPNSTPFPHILPPTVPISSFTTLLLLPLTTGSFNTLAYNSLSSKSTIYIFTQYYIFTNPNRCWCTTHTKHDASPHPTKKYNTLYYTNANKSH